MFVRLFRLFRTTTSVGLPYSTVMVFTRCILAKRFYWEFQKCYTLVRHWKKYVTHWNQTKLDEIMTLLGTSTSFTQNLCESLFDASFTLGSTTCGITCIWHLNWTQVCIFNTHAITYEDTWGGTIHVFKFVCNKVYTVTWCMQPAYIFGQIYIHTQADSRFAPNIFEFSSCRVEHVPDKIKGMFATRYISRIVVKSNMRWCHGKVEPVQSSTWVNKKK